jgi:hypothetical protein
MNKSSAVDKSLGFCVKTESPKPFRHPNTLELTRSLMIHPRLSCMITSSRAFVKHFSYIILTLLIFFSNDREADGGCEGRLFVPVLRELFRGGWRDVQGGCGLPEFDVGLEYGLGCLERRCDLPLRGFIGNGLHF